MSNRQLLRASFCVLLVGLLVPLAGCGSGSSSATGGSSAAASSTASGGDYLSALARTRQKAQEVETTNKLKQIGIAFHIFQDTYGYFPNQTGDPKGKSKLSWRVAILPFIEQDPLYRQFKQDEPWDSPHNSKLLDKMPDLYRDSRFQTKEEKATTTYFQGFIGKGGVLQGHKDGLSLVHITNANGSSNTLLIVDASTPVPWTKPEDIVHDPAKPLPPLGGPKKSPTFLGLFCDGHVQHIPTATNEQTLRYMIQWDNQTPFKLP